MGFLFFLRGQKSGLSLGFSLLPKYTREKWGFCERKHTQDHRKGLIAGFCLTEAVRSAYLFVSPSFTLLGFLISKMRLEKIDCLIGLEILLVK